VWWLTYEMKSGVGNKQGAINSSGRCK